MARTAQGRRSFRVHRAEHVADIADLAVEVEVGEGYATPLVVGSTVYTFTRRDEREVMTALGAGTGIEQWRSSYVAPYSPSQPAVAHGAGPKATPLLHDGKLFTMGISGIVSAFDAATGRLLWQTPPRRNLRCSAPPRRLSASTTS